MAKRISKIILYNNKNQVLLQLRENNPKIAYPNTWTLFGGRIEPNESPKNALERELKEEIERLKLTNLKKLFTKNRDQDGVEVEDNIFCAKVKSNINDMKLLEEGQEMRFFSEDELYEYNVFIPFRDYIIAFLKKRKNY